jgi:predicted Zn-dependent protease
MKNETLRSGLVLLVVVIGLPAVPVNSQEPGSIDRYRQDVKDTLSAMNQWLSAGENDISPEDEYYIGRAVGANILKKHKPYRENRDLVVYLNKICHALAFHAGAVPFNGYHVMILDNPELNAFATSGGHIFISQGLVEAAASEDMLAAVIAHEIAHIQLRHGIAMIREDRVLRDLRITAERAGEIARREAALEGPEDFFADSVRTITDTLMTTGFSQQQEFEADSLAVSLLFAAGYEPSGLVDVLQLLQKTGGDDPGGMYHHPPVIFRIFHAEQILKNYPLRDTRHFRVPRFNKLRKASNFPALPAEPPQHC